ncbi:DNA polymerase III subunit chi [Sphingorhabdus sp.]|jgi:DNA polymerase-3 subunit chi|uniref:DNA polymerase III subunit chi n=1 Tax=Sphingorhabdus sp. TaxID=1902408 RepID=UPI0037841767
MQVDFYQLTRDPAEKVLPAIAQRILDNKGRLLIISDDAGQLDAISGALWTARTDSFLAHAKSGEGDDALQPILLSQDTDAPNGAKFVALADGNWRAVTEDFERIFYLFPPEQTDNARSAWRTLGDGVERRYWKQDGGKWVQGP